LVVEVFVEGQADGRTTPGQLPRTGGHGPPPSLTVYSYGGSWPLSSPSSAGLVFSCSPDPEIRDDQDKAVKEAGGKGGRVEPVKTKASRRRVRIAPGTVAALQAHLASRARVAEGGPLFCGPRGRHLYSADLYHDYWWPLLERAGLDIRLHDLRHTCATLLLM